MEAPSLIADVTEDLPTVGTAISVLSAFFPSVVFSFLSKIVLETW